jgi:hypothetical protein
MRRAVQNAAPIEPLVLIDGANSQRGARNHVPTFAQGTSKIVH